MTTTGTWSRLWRDVTAVPECYPERRSQPLELAFPNRAVRWQGIRALVRDGILRGQHKERPGQGARLNLPDTAPSARPGPPGAALQRPTPPAAPSWAPARSAPRARRNSRPAPATTPRSGRRSAGAGAG